MKSENANRVFSCCGQYIAVTKAAADVKIICPRCGASLNAPLKVPRILIITK